MIPWISSRRARWVALAVRVSCQQPYGFDCLHVVLKSPTSEDRLSKSASPLRIELVISSVRRCCFDYFDGLSQFLYSAYSTRAET